MFHLSKNNRFGLEYPNLELRQEKFMQEVLKKLLIYENEIETLLKSNYYLSDYTKLSGQVGAEILYKEPNRSFFSDYEETYKDKNEPDFLTVFKKYKTSYLAFLFLLDLLMIEIKTTKIKFNYNETAKKSLDCLCEEIIYLFEQFDLDYYWNKKTKRIERKLDEINIGIINQNIQKVSKDFDYQSCIDEFLKPRKDINKNHSLNHLKSVLESIAKSKGVVKPFSYDKKKFVDKLFPGKQPDYFKSCLEFIISNIHHPQDNGIPYNFTEQEYVYWWLKINNLIYILN